MKLLIALLLLLCCFSNIKSSAQIKRLDTLGQLGKAGYRVYCSNKSAEKNSVNVKLIGFENTARDLDFVVDGRIKSIVVEDFNNDTYPDLLLFSYSDNAAVKVNVIGVASQENKNCMPIFFPDIRDDAKLKAGYNGHDEFTVIEGNLFRKFPLYMSDNLSGPPTGVTRTIQYKMVTAERGAFKFQVVRSYESK